jgi:tetratricopeptide (TPR) repeat protein
MSQDLSAAKEALERMHRLAEEVGQPTLRWTTMCLEATQAEMRGRFVDAEALAHEAFELGSVAGLADATRTLWSQLFWIRYQQGRMAEVLDVFQRASRRPEARSHTRVAVCLVLCELDRLDEARPIFDTLAADHFAGVGYPWVQNLAMLAKVSPAIGRPEHSAFLYEQLAPHHAVVVTFTTFTAEPVAAHLGLLATALRRYDEAETYFEEAAEIAERLEAPHWLARTRLEWARMLLSRAAPGDAEQARELAALAKTTAEELGMARVAAQAGRLLDG